MARGKLIVIEGTDGSGKTAQISKLKAYLKQQGQRCVVFDFPNYDSFSGQLVARYLRGEIGDLTSSSPYLVCLPYALDRLQAKKALEHALEQNSYVVVNRYTYSNIAFQAPKIKDEGERERFRQWVMQLEFEQLGIPQPDQVIFLYVPVQVSRRWIANREARSYLKERQQDMHEESNWLLKAASNEYMSMAQNEKWEIIRCCDDKDEPYSIEKIHQMVLEVLA